MAMKIVTADQRLAAPLHINIAIFGEAGIGKTTQAKSLPPETTLFVNLEAGELALEGWPATFINLTTWEDITMFASVLRGPDHSMRPNQKYSEQYYITAVTTLAGHAGMTPEQFLAWLAKFDIIYVDSITVAGRWALNWAKGQPEAFNKQGQPDMRGAYGIVGQEIVGWITALQHTANKSIIIVGGLKEVEDDYKRKSWKVLIEGSKGAEELPYIFDQVITMQEVPFPDGRKYRAFVCHKTNDWSFPAKDRSGRLEMIEQPDLGKLIEKIRSGHRRDTMVTSIPQSASQSPADPAAPKA